jgi:hypothetical protein
MHRHPAAAKPILEPLGEHQLPHQFYTDFPCLWFADFYEATPVTKFPRVGIIGGCRKLDKVDAANATPPRRLFLTQQFVSKLL